MQISKPMLTSIVVFTMLLSGMVGYGTHYVNIDREKSDLHMEIAELKQETVTMQMQLAGAGIEVDTESDLADSRPGQLDLSDYLKPVLANANFSAAQN